VLFQRPPRDPTWLDKFIVLSHVNLQALKKARAGGGAAEWKIALQTGTAVKELLERYKAAGSPDVLNRYPGDNDAIIVIDDDASIRKALKRLLGCEGWVVSTYTSAEDFLEASWPSGAGCMIIDIDLPGMSGLELQRKLERSECRHVPVIFMTGCDDPERKRQAMQRAHAFLLKPFSKDDLFHLVRSATKVVR
jgi:CheY-like chemotaxis protein